MHWIALAILALGVTVLQTTVLYLVKVPVGSVGWARPDLLAVVAVFVCLTAQGTTNVMLAAWGLGMLADLTTGGAPTVVGPMSLAYVVAAAAVFHIREAFFRDRVSTRAILGGLFCLLAHGLWVTVQCLLGMRHYGSRMLLALLVSAYTAVAAPICFLGLVRIERWLVVPSGRRSRR